MANESPLVHTDCSQPRYQTSLSTTRSEKTIITTSTSKVEKARQRKNWDRSRIICASVVETNTFDHLMGAVIIFNIGLMIYETNLNAGCNVRPCAPAFVEYVNYVLLGIYTLEACARFYFMRLRFFCNKWCLLDFFVVAIGTLDVAMTKSGTSTPLQGIEMLKLFRIFRLMRAFRMVKRFPQLYSMIRGFVSAMAAMAWGFVMIIFLLVMWSILAVEVINGKNQHIDHEIAWCYDAFSSVEKATIYFFQTLVAGDSWGTCAIPIITENPETSIIFASALVCVQLGFTNLILSVIVDTASQAREEDKRKRELEKAKEEDQETKVFRSVLRSIDKDGSGNVSLQELLDGYEYEPKIQKMLSHLNVDRKDLVMLFHLMDSDDSGALSYEEFLDYIEKAERQDMRVQMMTVKLQVSNLTRKFQKQISGIANILEGFMEGVESPARERSEESLRTKHSCPNSPSPAFAWLRHQGSSMSCTNAAAMPLRATPVTHPVVDHGVDTKTDPASIVSFPVAKRFDKGDPTLKQSMNSLQQSLERHSDALERDSTARVVQWEAALQQQTQLLQDTLMLEGTQVASMPSRKLEQHCCPRTIQIPRPLKPPISKEAHDALTQSDNFSRCCMPDPIMGVSWGGDVVQKRTDV